MSGLTPEQIAIRATGIGASEVATILSLSPHGVPIDVWLEKRGHKKPSATEADFLKLGRCLEDGARRFYIETTGREVMKCGETYRHPKYPHVLASPDSVPAGFKPGDLGGGGGPEIKIVGRAMAHHYSEDGKAPDYHEIQARQCMAVLGTDWWDILAIVNGTEPKLIRVERDLEIEEMLIDACESFWADYVEADEPPPIERPEDRKAYLLARYPWEGDEKRRRIDDSEEAAELAAELLALEEDAERVKGRIEEIKNAFRERIQGDYGISGAWGQALNYPLPGQVAWSKVAAELAGGAVPSAIIEKHRGPSTRTCRLYPPSKAKPRAKPKGSSK